MRPANKSAPPAHEELTRPLFAPILALGRSQGTPLNPSPPIATMSQTECAVQVAAPAAFSLLDCDVHNYPNSIDDLMPFLSVRWQAYVRQSGV